ncbi:hypothetical protein [Sphingomonas sp.]|uniref:hypothetical protein n=1 Tax=Sphingomonas sp. TaxID=28214 RepID=UPI00307D15E8
MERYRHTGKEVLRGAEHVCDAASVEQASAIVAALNASAPLDQQELEDVIADAITDSMDMDWTSTIGAKAVVRALQQEGVVA